MVKLRISWVWGKYSLVETADFNDDNVINGLQIISGIRSPYLAGRQDDIRICKIIHDFLIVESNVNSRIMISTLKIFGI